jgi:hypothetical protein
MTNKKYGMGLCAIAVVAIICTISNSTPSNMAASPVSMNKIYELFVPGKAEFISKYLLFKYWIFYFLWTFKMLIKIFFLGEH